MHIKASHSLLSAVKLLYKYVFCCLTVRKKEFLEKQQFSSNMTVAKRSTAGRGKRKFYCEGIVKLG